MQYRRKTAQKQRLNSICKKCVILCKKCVKLCKKVLIYDITILRYVILWQNMSFYDKICQFYAILCCFDHLIIKINMSYYAIKSNTWKIVYAFLCYFVSVGMPIAIVYKRTTLTISEIGSKRHNSATKSGDRRYDKV